jgi:hypothetical protein
MTGAALTLRERLTVRTPLGAPSAEVRRTRERLCEFIRAVEGEAFVADNDATRAQLRRLLGWDDEAFAAFITSPLLTHSSPHAGMNAFPPMLAYPWIQRCIQTLAGLSGPGRPVHIRTLVMHNNLGDLRWRPYAWWHRSPSGAIVKTAFFSRSHAARRQVLLAQPPPQIDDADCLPCDRAALALARHARNHAWFAALYRMQIERLAGFHSPHGTVEVPLNILNAFTFTEESLERWVALAEETPERRVRKIDAGGELADLARDEAATYAAHIRELGRYPIVCTNAQNFAQVYRLGITTMIGAELMARYVVPMNEDIRALFERIGWSHPFPEFIPITRMPEEITAPADEPSWRALRASGIKGALSICVADHREAVAARLDPLLSRPYAEFHAPA